MAAPSKRVLSEFVNNYRKPGNFDYRAYINTHGFDPFNGITVRDYFQGLIKQLPEYKDEFNQISYLSNKLGPEDSTKIVRLFNRVDFSLAANRKLAEVSPPAQPPDSAGKPPSEPLPQVPPPPISQTPAITKTPITLRKAARPGRKMNEIEGQTTPSTQITRISTPRVTSRTIITSSPTRKVSRIMTPRRTRIPGRTVPGSSSGSQSQPTSIQQNPTLSQSPGFLSGLRNLIKPGVEELGNGIGNAANSAADSLGRLNNRARNIKSSAAAKRILIVLIIFLLIFVLIGGLGALLDFLNPQALNQFEIKKSGNLSIENDKEINYQINVKYSGIDPVTIDIIDRIPAQTDFMRADQGGQQESTNSGVIIWKNQRMLKDSTKTVNLTIKPKPGEKDFWIENKAEIRINSVSLTSLIGNSTGLLPNPLPQQLSNWPEIKKSILDSINKYPESLEAYKKAAQVINGPWEPLAGLHFVETGSDPQSTKSLVSGRPIGGYEPDIPISACGGPATEPGTPIPIGIGCGFATFLDSAIYSAKHLARQIGRTPTTFQDVVTALSRYNGGGNSNCDEDISYSNPSNCPNQAVNKNGVTVRAPLFYGEDDPYAMAWFDLAHSDMYLVFCGDKIRCSPLRPFGRAGAMAVVRALQEQ